MKKASRVSTGGVSHRRLSVGGTMLQTTPKPELPSSTKATPHPRTVKKIDRILQNDHTNVRMDDGFAALSAGNFLELHLKILL